MSTVLYTLPATATRIRYREPYLSDALNKKYQGIVTAGIYEGFDPEPGGGNRQLALQPGAVGHAAVVSSELDATVEVSTHLSGTLLFDLSSEAGNTVVVLLEANYLYPEETTAYIKMYVEGDPAIPASATFICKVDVPATAIPIPAASISLTGRTFPWATRDRNAVPMVALAKNTSFEFVSEATPTVGVAPPYWQVETTGVGDYKMSTTPGPSGFGAYVIGQSVAPIGTTHNNKFYQRYAAPISEATNRIRFGVKYQPVLAPTLNNPVLTVTLLDPGTGTAVQTLSVELDSSAGALGSWATYEETVTATSVAGLVQAYVAELKIDFNDTQYGSIGDAFYATDFVLEVEAASKAVDALPEHGGDERLNSLTLVDAGYAQRKGVVLSHNATTDLLSLAAVPGVTGTPGLYVPGTLTIGGGVVFGGDLTVTGDLYVNGGDIQRSTVGALNVGTNTTNITTLTLGADAAAKTTQVYGATVTVGNSVNTTSLTLGINSATLTSSLLGGTITVGSGATSTLSLGSTIANGATITVGSTTATGTNTTVNGVVLSVGNTNTSTLNLGFSSTSSATIRLGNAPGGGSVSTTIQGNTITLGADADTTSVSIGTTTTSSATVTLGNAPVLGTVATSIAGNTIAIGTATATTSITIGDGTSGTLRVAQYLDGNTGALSLGTDTTYTTTLVTLGNNSTPLTMAGTTINLGTNAASGTVTVSRTGQTTAIAGNATVAGTLDVTGIQTNTGVINANGGIGRSTAGTLTFGNDADVTAIQIGTAGSSGGVSISQSGQTTTVNGALSVTQATTVTGAINANGGVDRSTAATLSIGTTNANAVTISRTGITTTVAGSATVTETLTASSTINANGGVIDRSTSGTLTIGNTANVTGINIGTTNTTGGVTISRSGQNTTVQGNLGVGASPTNLVDVFGTNSPVLALTQTSATSAQYPTVQNTGYEATFTGHPVFSMRNSRGSSASTVPVIAADSLGALIFYGNTATAGSTTWTEGARIQTDVTAVPTTSTITAALSFKTSNAASSATTRMAISGGGNVVVSAPASGTGLTVTGGATALSHGVVGTGGSTSGNGVRGSGTGGLSGGYFEVGAASNANGVMGIGDGTGFGVYGAGGTTNGSGVYGIVSAGSGDGVTGLAGGTGFGVRGLANTGTGAAVRGEALGSQYGGHFSSTSGTALYVAGTTQLTGSLRLPATGVATWITNTISTYEMGTWTPTLYFAGANTNWTFTALGHYVKVGKLVHVTGSIQVTGKAAGFSTGVASIGALPFASADEAGSDPFQGLYVTFVQSPAAGMTATPLLSMASAGATQVFIYTFGAVNITDTGFQFGTIFRFAGTYVSFNP